MPSIPEDLDVFRVPHVHMTKLVHDIEKELSCINFGDLSAFSSLLHHLVADFKLFECHEDIENQVIVGPLLPRLPTNTTTTLHNDLHSDNRLRDLVTLVHDGLQLEYNSLEADRLVFGERLKAAIASFTVDYIPHMKEEEEVFLPLLVEYLTESELRQMTQKVVELHHFPPSQKEEAVGRAPSLLDLPPELLLRVFNFLSPVDLCRFSQVHPSLHALAFDGSLWQHLHPIRWANGHHQFFSPLTFEAEEEEEEEGISHDLILENNIAKELMSVEGKVNANLRHLSLPQDNAYMEHEARVLWGVMEYLLPQVGPHVRTLDLAHGKAVSNEVVFRMLRKCPNLSYLDLSHTGVSDFAFRGLLGRHHNFGKLEYIDLTGCVLVTDIAIQRIAQAIGFSQHSLVSLHCYCGGDGGGGGRGGGGGGGRGGGGGGCGREGGRGDGGGCGGGGGGGGCGGGGGGGGGWDGVGRSGGREGGGREEVDNAKGPQLKCLILSGCHLITDVGLRSLAMGGGLPNLQYLDLSGLCSITERGLNDLVSACPFLVPELLFYCDNILAGPYAECANGCQNVGLPGLCCREII